jgi:hypothetical protein
MDDELSLLLAKLDLACTGDSTAILDIAVRVAADVKPSAGSMAPLSALLGSLTLSSWEWKDDGGDGGDDDEEEEEEEQHGLAKFDAQIPPSTAVSSSSATAAKTAELSSYLSSMRPPGCKPSESFKVGGCRRYS